jgi:tetratricopeptide (TPR) repeat protein
MKNKFLYGITIFIIGGFLSFYLTSKYYTFKQYAYSTVLTLSGMEKYQKGDDYTAIILLYQALGSYPNMSLAYLTLGDLYFKKGVYNLSKECYQKALSIENHKYSFFSSKRNDSGIKKYIEERIKKIEEIMNRKNVENYIVNVKFEFKPKEK